MTKYDINSITSPHQTIKSLSIKIKDLRDGILQKSLLLIQSLEGLALNIYPGKWLVVFVRMTARRNLRGMHYDFH